MSGTGVRATPPDTPPVERDALPDAVGGVSVRDVARSDAPRDGTSTIRERDDPAVVARADSPAAWPETRELRSRSGVGVTDPVFRGDTRSDSLLADISGAGVRSTREALDLERGAASNPEDSARPDARSFGVVERADPARCGMSAVISLVLRPGTPVADSDRDPGPPAVSRKSRVGGDSFAAALRSACSRVERETPALDRGLAS
jgi:hypothetical protein